MHVQVSGEPTCIGKPTPNNNVYILDEDLQPLPIGTVGVMWAGGAGISRGYLNLPQKTSERYKPDPFVFDGQVLLIWRQILFLTAEQLHDVQHRRPWVSTRSSINSPLISSSNSRWREDGSLEHFGRIDDQVKVKVRSSSISPIIVFTMRLGIPCGIRWCRFQHGGALRSRGSCSWLINPRPTLGLGLQSSSLLKGSSGVLQHLQSRTSVT